MNNLAELMNMAHAGDKWARDRLVADNLGLVYAVVRRFEHRGHDREELFQIGCIGLMKAVDHFDVSLQLAFSTYAVPMITGEIRRFLRDDGMVKVSRTLKEQGYRSAGRVRCWCQSLAGNRIWRNCPRQQNCPQKRLRWRLRQIGKWNPYTGRFMRKTGMNS